MKVNTMLATTTALAMAAGAALADDPVKIGMSPEPYPPFIMPDSAGNWSGWEIDIANAICEAEQMDCEIVFVSWDGIIPSLLGEQIDVIMASMSITAERAKKIDFTDYYYKTPAVIVAPKGSDIEPTPEGLEGKILGVQAATNHQAYAQKYFADTTADIRIYQTQDEANQDLYSGRIDAVEAGSLPMTDFVESDMGSCCEIVGAVASDDAILGDGIGAGVRKSDDELREQLNDGIAKILADGTHEKITDKYFSTSIYGE